MEQEFRPQLKRGHFQPLEQSHAEVDAAISSCDKAAFEGAMHRMQDYWSHKNKGYNWDPKTLAGRAGGGLLAGGVSGMVGAVIVGEYVSPVVGHGAISANFLLKKYLAAVY